MAERRLPALHAVTDDAVLARPDFPALAREVLAAGGPDVALHLRAPRAGGRFLFELAEPLARAAARNGALFVVNDRADVALAVGAGGAHVGSRGLPVEDARRLLGPGRFVGVSVHMPRDGDDAAAAGADYVFAGNIWSTPSHKGRLGQGPEGLLRFTSAPILVVAIGGVTPERVATARVAGAGGVAAIRAVWDADDPARAVARFLEAWKDADADD